MAERSRSPECDAQRRGTENTKTMLLHALASLMLFALVGAVQVSVPVTHTTASTPASATSTMAAAAPPTTLQVSA